MNWLSATSASISSGSSSSGSELDVDVQLEPTSCARRKPTPHHQHAQSEPQPFFDRGSKLIQYHGWSDPQIARQQRAVLNRGGDGRWPRRVSLHRLFAAPGMGYSAAVKADSDSRALEQWSSNERRIILASRIRRRGRDAPLCPYRRS
jgi:hypothetical protein